MPDLDRYAPSRFRFLRAGVAEDSRRKEPSNEFSGTTHPRSHAAGPPAGHPSTSFMSAIRGVGRSYVRRHGWIAAGRRKVPSGTRLQTEDSGRTPNSRRDVDYLRQIDPLPREIRTFARRREEIASDLEGCLGRTPTDGELAAELDVPIAKYRRWILSIRASNTNSLDSTAKWDDELPQVAAPVVDMEAVESLHRLETAIGNLPDREAQVAAALTDGKSAREIASELGLPETTVSRIKTRAIRHLRLSLRAA